MPPPHRPTSGAGDVIRLTVANATQYNLYIMVDTTGASQRVVSENETRVEERRDLGDMAEGRRVEQAGLDREQKSAVVDAARQNTNGHTKGERSAVSHDRDYLKADMTSNVEDAQVLQQDSHHGYHDNLGANSHSHSQGNSDTHDRAFTNAGGASNSNSQHGSHSQANSDAHGTSGFAFGGSSSLDSTATANNRVRSRHNAHNSGGGGGVNIAGLGGVNANSFHGEESGTHDQDAAMNAETRARESQHGNGGEEQRATSSHSAGAQGSSAANSNNYHRSGRDAGSMASHNAAAGSSLDRSAGGEGGTRINNTASYRLAQQQRAQQGRDAGAADRQEYESADAAEAEARMTADVRDVTKGQQKLHEVKVAQMHDEARKTIHSNHVVYDYPLIEDYTGAQWCVGPGQAAFDLTFRLQFQKGSVRLKWRVADIGHPGHQDFQLQLVQDCSYVLADAYSLHPSLPLEQSDCYPWVDATASRTNWLSENATDILQHPALAKTWAQYVLWKLSDKDQQRVLEDVNEGWEEREAGLSQPFKAMVKWLKASDAAKLRAQLLRYKAEGAEVHSVLHAVQCKQSPHADLARMLKQQIADAAKEEAKHKRMLDSVQKSMEFAQYR